MNWKKEFIRHKNYLSKGMGEASSLRYLTYIIAIGGTITEALTFQQVVLLGVAFLIASYLGGWMWDRLKLYHEEAEFGNERNYFVKEMRGMETRIKKHIDRRLK